MVAILCIGVYSFLFRLVIAGIRNGTRDPGGSIIAASYFNYVAEIIMQLLYKAKLSYSESVF